MATELRKTIILPVISSHHNAFAKGFRSAQEHGVTGWPIQYAPREATLVQFLLQAKQLLVDDDVTGDCYEVQYIAGMLAGWLRRGI